MWWVQDIAAQLPVILMGNIKNKKILDLCTAPGGNHTDAYQGAS